MWEVTIHERGRAEASRRPGTPCVSLHGPPGESLLPSTMRVKHVQLCRTRRAKHSGVRASGQRRLLRANCDLQCVLWGTKQALSFQWGAMGLCPVGCLCQGSRWHTLGKASLISLVLFAKPG